MSDRAGPDPSASPTPGTPTRACGSSCRVCSDTGLMRWQQPVPVPGGRMELREMTHPCTCEAARAAGVWRHPAAEADRVIDAEGRAAGGGPRGRAGQAAAAQHTQSGLAALLAAADPTRPDR